jgi:CheY-like chemotaxis protein
MAKTDRSFMPNKTILVIEDDKPIREMIKALLEIEGYTVLAAANGKEGIMALQQDARPHLILLDMMMPVMNGWDFLDFLKANSEGSKIPVVIVSAYSETAKSTNPDGIVSKPVQLKELLNAVTQLAS